MLVVREPFWVPNEVSRDICCGGHIQISPFNVLTGRRWRCLQALDFTTFGQPLGLAER